jgi:hypothetical protein
MSEHEEWRPVVGYEDHYKVSNLGRIWSNRKDACMAAHPNPKGYPAVSLRKDGVTRTRTVHRLVAIAFLAPVDAAMEVNHKDGNRANPRLDNLEWVTRSGNETHSRRVLRNLCQPVIAVSLKGPEVYRFESITEAAEALGLPPDRPRQVMRGVQHQTKGWVFVRIADILRVDKTKADRVDDEMVEAGLHAAREATDARLARYSVVRSILEAALAAKKEA